jgi:hypothetical protein
MREDGDALRDGYVASNVDEVGTAEVQVYVAKEAGAFADFYALLAQVTYVNARIQRQNMH